MIKKLKENKTKIYIGLSLVVLIIVLIVVSVDNKLEPENVGNDVIPVEEKVEQKIYPKFIGEDIDITSLINKELVKDENGIRYFPGKTAVEITNAFIESTNKLGLENKTNSIEQTLRNNLVTNEVLNTAFRKTLMSANKDSSETLEVTVYTDGIAGKYIYNLIIDTNAETWERSNEIFNTVLTELGIDDTLREALIKSNQTFKTIKYNTGETSFTLDLKRTADFSCNTALVISHNIDYLENIESIEELLVSESLEDFDIITAEYNLIQSDDYEYSFNINDKTFGKDVIDIIMKLFNKEYIGGIVDSTFKGIKGSDGTKYNEEFNFVNTVISSDGELEIVVSLNYLNGSTNIELDINNLKEDFTEEEKEYCKKVLVDFLNVTYTDCGVTDASELKGTFSQDTLAITDANGNQYMVTYGEIDNASMISYMIEGYDEVKRSSEFKTYN